MTPKFPDVTVQLTGKDGNAFAVLARVRTALQDAGHYEEAKQFMAEAITGDYDHLLQTVMAYVEVE